MTATIRIIIFILISFTLKSQTTGPNVQFRANIGTLQSLHQYDATTTFPTNGIADDFGPRQLNRTSSGFSEYDWHGGIDYNSNINDANNDKGDIIINVEDGNIKEARVTNNGIKRIEIIGSHNFAYVHIFENGTLPISNGGCILKYMDAPNSTTWAIIFQQNGIYTSIGPTKNYPTDPKVTFVDELGNPQTLDVFVGLLAAGMPVASLGDSGINGAHLHLHTSTIINNISDQYSKNPLRIVSFNNVDYNIEIYKENDNVTGISVLYPGNLLSTIQCRIGGLISTSTVANRYTRTMSIDDVNIKIKKKFENFYSDINGPNITSKFSLGSRSNSTKTNITNSQNNYTTGLWTRTNMQPFAYATPNNTIYTHHNWDEYYFADFSTRIHNSDIMNGSKKVSDTPLQSRYNDGEYDCIIEATDVRNIIYQGPKINGTLTPVEFTLDNFMPFITEVKMYQTTLLSFPSQVYALSRHQSEGQTNVLDDGYIANTVNTNPVYDPTTPYELSFEINTSEPMDYVDIEIEGSNYRQDAILFGPGVTQNGRSHAITVSQCFGLM